MDNQAHELSSNQVSDERVSNIQQTTTFSCTSSECNQIMQFLTEQKCDNINRPFYTNESAGLNRVYASYSNGSINQVSLANGPLEYNPNAKYTFHNYKVPSASNWTSDIR